VSDTPLSSVTEEALRRKSPDSAQAIKPNHRAARIPVGLLSKPRAWIVASVAIAAVLSIGVALPYVTGVVIGHSLAGPETGSAPAAAFVGSETCTGCRRAQADLWRTSQHKHAMDHATEKTVLGDFSDTRFEYFDVRSRFFRENGKFFVETDGPDGKLGAFAIKYTFGLDPL
jgi:hypothetical protein